MVLTLRLKTTSTIAWFSCQTKKPKGFLKERVIERYASQKKEQVLGMQSKAQAAELDGEESAATVQELTGLLI